MIAKYKKIKRQSKGALLLELLIVIALLAVILSVAANGVLLSLRSNKSGGERDVAIALASESLEAVRSASEEDWQNIYALTKSSQHYQTTVSGTKWILSTGDETININNSSYTRYLTIDNVSRDSTTRLINTSYVSADDDPSTQKVTVNVTWSTGGPTVLQGYLYRWKNKVCAQTSWTTADPGNTVHICSDASYDSKDAGINLSGGTIKVQ